VCSSDLGVILRGRRSVSLSSPFSSRLLPYLYVLDLIGESNRVSTEEMKIKTQKKEEKRKRRKRKKEKEKEKRKKKKKEKKEKKEKKRRKKTRSTE
jgi:hypothetical protein